MPTTQEIQTVKRTAEVIALALRGLFGEPLEDSAGNTVDAGGPGVFYIGATAPDGTPSA